MKTLLVKPAVPPIDESLIYFDNCCRQRSTELLRNPTALDLPEITRFNP